MKRTLFVSAVVPLALAAALCACGSAAGADTPSEETQSTDSQAQTAPAAADGAITVGDSFSILSGTVLSDGSVYLVGQEQAGGFCAYVSADDGDTWTKEALPWADQTVTGISLRPDGAVLGVQGQRVVYAPRGGELQTVDLSALGAVDGISAVYPIDADTFTVSGGRTETFADEEGKQTQTVHPIPFEDMVLQYDGSLAAQWGDGTAEGAGGYYTSDGTKLYYLEYAGNECRSLNAEGQTESYGALGKVSGAAFCRNGIFYYVDDQGVAAYDTASRSDTRLLTDSLAPYLQADASCTTLVVTDRHVFAVVSALTTDAQTVYRYEI